MTTIYLVTHPEASHQVDGVVGGWFDSDLTAPGVAQASAIAAALPPAPILSSDLRRARRTADIIAARLGSQVTLDPDLREKSYGEAEGKPRTWLRERAVPLPEHGERLRHDEGIAGAETRMDLAVRAYRAMDRIQARPGDRQIVVTHGGTTTLLITAWLGMPIEAAGRAHFQVSPGGISVLRKDPGNHSHQLLRLNDTSHLN